MNKVIFVFLFLFTCHLSVQAQKYRTAAGVRFGGNNFGITAQQKILKKTTIEAIGAVGGREVSATGLVEQHFPLLGPGFNIYLGAGAHVGHLKDNGAFYGGDLIAGAELKLPIAPLVLSFDLKPTFHVNHEEWGGVGSGFSIRYILVKEKKEKKKLFGIFNRKDNDRDKRKSRDEERGGWFKKKKKVEEKPKGFFKRIFDK
ncbi:hypothetical protein HUW51_02240 [Adhaeribacter swui]|uniref:Outer membrane beta-barrel protein n=1 Tax=Adhaeribacter swui TaxID=2086471 RepID=A0A7G7G366_9BACT|nr:hypothetical protein [Adhaeribacter swui]QNF31600.1 hypothetical protein HUW51_02240 [Adhaeribacter swui]